jgi:CheY-like chemotaxis protein
MESRKRDSAVNETLKIMIVGNNPIDLSKMLTRIQKINDRKVITEIAFDMQSILQRLEGFRPDFILLDDNIGRSALKEIVMALHNERTTRDIPITVIKNSNYSEAISGGVLDYMLKETLTGDSLYRALLNSLKVRRTQLYLYQAYRQRKGQLLRLFRREPAFQI